jgi:hypothetical protein
LNGGAEAAARSADPVIHRTDRKDPHESVTGLGYVDAMTHDLDLPPIHDPFERAMAALVAAGLDPVTAASWTAADREAA